MSRTCYHPSALFSINPISALTLIYSHTARTSWANKTRQQSCAMTFHPNLKKLSHITFILFYIYFSLQTTNFFYFSHKSNKINDDSSNTNASDSLTDVK